MALQPNLTPKGYQPLLKTMTGLSATLRRDIDKKVPITEVTDIDFENRLF